ncbi:MAG: SDR family NAD(P)-dependent oxidoreductase, partial [Stackebrandtia sp.]
MTRTVVVTGGGTGIGRAIAAAFVSDDATVFITGRRADMLDTAKAKLGGDVRTVVCDSSDVEQVEGLAASISGKIDVLVNNAGGNRDLESHHGRGSLGAALPGAKPSSLRALADAWLANLETNL